MQLFSTQNFFQTNTGICFVVGCLVTENILNQSMNEAGKPYI